MAVNVRIMNWNVQNFGPAKSGLKRNAFDIVTAIARTVVENDVDIFVMLEVNTTDDSTAYSIATVMLEELKKYAAKKDPYAPPAYTKGVLSPNTGREFYAYFVRDPTAVVPLPILRAQNSNDVPEELGIWPSISNAEFKYASGPGIHNRWFPLLAPDRQVTLLSSPYTRMDVHWPGVRKPVLGLFYVPGASVVNQILPIVACHFAADPTIAAMQIHAFKAFGFFEDLSDNPPDGLTLSIKLAAGAAAQQVPIHHYVLLGDFNIDYNDNTDAYNRLLKASPLGEGMTGWINDKTHLVTLDNYSSRTMKTTRDLAINAFDNFFTRADPTSFPAVTAGNPQVYNLAEDLRLRAVTLSESINHYKELDQRGFTETQKYERVTLNWTRQYEEKSHMILTPGALAGTRLISDHLPVLLDLTLP